jgi:ATP-dependent DNA helicase DinG
MFFAVDTETTGLIDAKPIEIAIVNLENVSFNMCERICTHAGLITPEAFSVHHISSDMLLGCKSELEVMTLFIDFIVSNAPLKEPIVLVAHNANFDKGVIERALFRCDLVLPSNVTWQCTQKMSIDMGNARGRGKNTLEACCKREGIEYVNAHSALPDAIMCGRLFTQFMSKLKLNDTNVANALLLLGLASCK